jgi:hypothetical protein
MYVSRVEKIWIGEKQRGVIADTGSRVTEIPIH